MRLLTAGSLVRVQQGEPSELYLQFEPFVFRLQVFSFLKPLISRGFSLFCIEFSNVTQMSKQRDFKYKSEIILLFEPLLSRFNLF